MVHTGSLDTDNGNIIMSEDWNRVTNVCMRKTLRKSIQLGNLWTPHDLLPVCLLGKSKKRELWTPGSRIGATNCAQIFSCPRRAMLSMNSTTFQTWSCLYKAWSYRVDGERRRTRRDQSERTSESVGRRNVCRLRACAVNCDRAIAIFEHLEVVVYSAKIYCRIERNS